MKTKELNRLDATPKQWTFDVPDVRRWFEFLPQQLTMFESLRLEHEIVGDTFVVRAELPGIDPDKDAEVWVADGLMHIRAERRFEEQSEKDGSFRSEFQYGSFHRAVALPKGAVATEVTATYKDGLLEIRLPIRQVDDSVAKVPILRA